MPTGADPAETAQLVAMKNEFMLSKGLDAAEIVTDEAIMYVRNLIFLRVPRFKAYKHLILSSLAIILKSTRRKGF